MKRARCEGTLFVDMVYNSAIVNRLDSSTSGSVRAVEIAWLAVIFLVPLFFNSASHQAFYLNKALLLQFLVVVMLGAVVVERVQNPMVSGQLRWRNLFSSPLHVSVLLFGFLVALATIFSITPSVSFWGYYLRKSGLLTLICWICFFLVLARYMRSRGQVLRAVSTLLLSSGIAAGFGILQHFFPEVISDVFHLAYRGRAYSTAGNPLSLSAFLAMVVPLNLALMVWFWRRGKRRGSVVKLCGLGFLLVLQLWCLWLAQYAITMLLYVIPILVFVLLLGMVGKRASIITFGVVCLVAVAVLASSLLVPLVLSPNDAGLSTGNPAEMSTAEGLGLKTLSWRVEYWRAALDIVVDSPVVPFADDRLHFLRRLLGYGPETFTVTFQSVCPANIGERSTLFSFLSRPHNHYLYLVTTVGVLGLASFLSVVLVFFCLCFRYFHRVGERVDKLILAGIMAGMVGYLADLFFNPETITADLVFWLFLGLVLAVGRLVGDQQPRKVSSIANVEIAKGGSVLSSKLRDYLSAVIFLLFMILGVIITIKPFLADVYLQKGLNLDARRSPEAVYAFEEAVELQPQEATYWSILGRYHYQMAKRITELNAKREFLAMSTSACAKATEQEPYIAFHYHTLADIYGYWAAQGDVEKWPVAFSLYDQSLRLFPNNVLILNKWVLALAASGNMEEARGKLEEAVALGGNWIGNMMCGLVLTGKGDERSGEIVSSLAVASDEFPYFIELCRLVAPYRMLPELGRGLEVYIQKAPEHWAPHAMLAATSLFTGDGDRSLQEFSVAMRLVPDKEEGYLVALISELSKVDPQLRTLLP